MGVGLVLFWPALFFIESDDQKEDVARLKGELKAVETAAIRKDCASLRQEIRADRKGSQRRCGGSRENISSDPAGKSNDPGELNAGEIRWKVRVISNDLYLHGSRLINALDHLRALFSPLVRRRR